MNPHEHSVAYPLNHVISIMPTEKEAITAFDTLIANGFLEAEVTLSSGPEPADRMRSWNVAAEILRQHGGHFINFFGKLEIERLV